MPTWKLTIEYDGGRYYGWQEQKNVRTISGELRAAAEGLLNARAEIAGAGRTDAGVHALGQVARLRVERNARSVGTVELVRGLNDRLPADINVLNAEAIAWNFDPRRDATGRFYTYQISTRRTAFGKKYVWWIKDRLNFEAMTEAAKLFIGRHDFVQFAEKLPEDKSTIVVVTQSEVTSAGNLILFHIGASHFLWKMVRRLTGALVAVGREALSVEDLSKMLLNPKECKQGFDVAAQYCATIWPVSRKSSVRRGRHLFDVRSDTQDLSAAG